MKLCTLAGKIPFPQAAGDVQVQLPDADVAVPDRVPNLGQRESAGQGVAGKCVTPVVDSHLAALPSQVP